VDFIIFILNGRVISADRPTEIILLLVNKKNFKRGFFLTFICILCKNYCAEKCCKIIKSKKEQKFSSLRTSNIEIS